MKIALLAILALLVAGCGGPYYGRSSVITAKENGQITISYCHERAKLSDYVKHVTYDVSEDEYNELEVGDWFRPSSNDNYLRTVRGSRCW